MSFAFRSQSILHTDPQMRSCAQDGFQGLEASLQGILALTFIYNIRKERIYKGPEDALVRI